LLVIFPSINDTVLQDVVDLLRGDSAVLDAAKKGNLSRVQKLIREEPSDNQLPLRGCGLYVGCCYGSLWRLVGYLP
jgi:hypothetical protein